MRCTWGEITSWVSRMQAGNSGWVYDNETGKRWDWGQALCREMYGPDWNDDEGYKEEGCQDMPNQSTINRAERWESGDWPDWAVEWIR